METPITTSSTLTHAQPDGLADSLPLNWVRKLFDRFLLDYGRKCTDMWGATDPDELSSHWARELAGYTREELRRGVDALSRLTWPPSLPEFKALCRPPMDPMVAFHEAQAGMLARIAGRMGEWSHPAIFWAAHKLGDVITNQAYSAVRPRWERALADSLAAGTWAAIQAPAVALPAPGRTLLEVAAARVRLEELQATSIVKTAPAPGAGLNWARKIIEREERGDRTVTLHSLKLAKAALRLR